MQQVIDIQKKTIEIHHGKHHQGYVNKLNTVSASVAAPSASTGRAPSASAGQAPSAPAGGPPSPKFEYEDALSSLANSPLITNSQLAEVFNSIESGSFSVSQVSGIPSTGPMSELPVPPTGPMVCLPAPPTGLRAPPTALPGPPTGLTGPVVPSTNVDLNELNMQIRNSNEMVHFAPVMQNCTVCINFYK